MKKENAKKTPEKKENVKIGRRKFLKKAALAGAAGAASAMVVGNNRFI